MPWLRKRQSKRANLFPSSTFDPGERVALEMVDLEAGILAGGIERNPEEDHADVTGTITEISTDPFLFAFLPSESGSWSPTDYLTEFAR